MHITAELIADFVACRLEDEVAQLVSDAAAMDPELARQIVLARDVQQRVDKRLGRRPAVKNRSRFPVDYVHFSA